MSSTEQKENKMAQSEPRQIVNEPTARTIFFIDWDDTLFPTTHIRALETHAPEELEGSELMTSMCRLQKEICRLLNKCRGLGIVKIVTNAAHQWPRKVGARFMPWVMWYLENHRIEIISARNVYSSYDPLNPTAWKTEAFVHEIDRAFPNDSRVNVVSLGDGSAERDASMALEDMMPTSFIKSIKFDSQPHVDTITTQLTYVSSSIGLVKEHEGSQHVDTDF